MTTTDLRGYKPVRDHLWLAYDRFTTLVWKAWGIIPAVDRYRDLAVRVDKARSEIIELRNMMPVVAELNETMRRVEACLDREEARGPGKPSLQLVGKDDAVK